MKRQILFFGVFFACYLGLLAGALFLSLPVYPKMEVLSRPPTSFAVAKGKTIHLLLLSPDEAFYSNVPTNLKFVAEWNDGSGLVPIKPVSYQVISDDGRHGKLFGHAVLSITPAKNGEATISVIGDLPKHVKLAAQQPLLPAFITLGLITFVAAGLSVWLVYWRRPTAKSDVPADVPHKR